VLDPDMADGAVELEGEREDVVVVAAVAHHKRPIGLV
jgi:hypothetical protein